MQHLKPERIAIFDGLRTIAVLMVMLYHFFAHSEGRYYNYVFKTPEILHYFYLGVQLFFIISGFVITLTLTRTKGFIDFLLKRYTRLAPGMLICSVVTFLFFVCFDRVALFGSAQYFPNLVISNTFINPNFFDYAFGISTVYLDGSYWTLWIEWQFYVAAGILFFLSPRHFLVSFSVLAGMMFLYMVFAESSYTLGLYDSPDWKMKLARLEMAVENFGLIRHGLWFLAGIIVYKMYAEGRTAGRLIFLILVFLLQAFWENNLYIYGFCIFCLGVLLLFLYKPAVLSFLRARLFVQMGIASYAIYLIHESIGMYVILKLSVYFGDWNWVLPLLLILFFCVFGYFSTKYVEIPLQRKLRNWIATKLHV